jgi:hypothetical protein
MYGIESDHHNHVVHLSPGGTVSNEKPCLVKSITHTGPASMMANRMLPKNHFVIVFLCDRICWSFANVSPVIQENVSNDELAIGSWSVVGYISELIVFSGSIYTCCTMTIAT